MRSLETNPDAMNMAAKALVPTDLHPMQTRLLAGMLLQLNRQMNFELLGALMFYNNLYLKEYRKHTRSKYARKTIEDLQKVNGLLSKFFDELHRCQVV